MAKFRLPQERAALGGVALLATFLVATFLFQSSSDGPSDLKSYYAIEVAHEADEERTYYTRVADNKRMSPWHDIPLKPLGDGIAEDHFVFICEIPRGTRAKMEINKETPFNPIIQDTKKGKLRFYHTDSLVNYGAFPQTWEDPTHADTLVPKYAGDNDPTDVIDVSSRVSNSGDVYVVKVIGALGMIDGDELDWKIVVIDAADVLAQEVDDVAALGESHPLRQRLTDIRVWFRDYKLPDGKPENKFVNDGAYYGKADALKVVQEQHTLWAHLVQEPRPADAKLWWEHQPNAA